jgi:hypothetical protein
METMATHSLHYGRELYAALLGFMLRTWWLGGMFNLEIDGETYSVRFGHGDVLLSFPGASLLKLEWILSGSGQTSNFHGDVALCASLVMFIRTRCHRTVQTNRALNASFSVGGVVARQCPDI